MASTIDYIKRSIFNSTKADLAKVFFSAVNIIDEQETYNEKGKEDLVKFINDLAFSANPASTISLAPNYYKYIDFFIKAARQQSKSILLEASLRTDPNIIVTRIISMVSTFSFTIGWSLLEPKHRERLKLGAAGRIKNFDLLDPNYQASLLYNRIEKGMPPIPQFIVSGAQAVFGNAPGVFGTPYILLDLWDDIDWQTQADKEIKDLAKTAKEQEELDPCEEKDPITEMDCERDAPKLIKELNKFEE